MVKLKVGDVVQLQSGSPNMTIMRGVSPDKSDGVVTCIWYENGEIKNTSMPEATLILVRAADSPKPSA